MHDHGSFSFYGDLYADRTYSMVSSEVRDLLAVTARPDIISLAGGLPCTQVIPPDMLVELAERVFREDGPGALQYGPTDGYAPLKRWLCEVMREEGLRANPEDLIVTHGSQQALDLVAKVFLDPGDPVAVELPSYVGALNAFANYQARPLGVPLDGEGLVVEALDELLRARQRAGEPLPKLVYLIPNFHNPAGVTLSLERRRRLVELARRWGLVILEDDAYGELRFEGEPLPPLAALAPEGRVFYLGSFSKVLTPGVRVGWIVAPAEVIRKLSVAKQGTDLCTNALGQKLVVEALRRGLLEPHVRGLRDLYRVRRDRMLAALERHFPAGARWTRPEGGFFVWLRLPEGVDTRALLPEAVRRERVGYISGWCFFCDGSGHNTIRLAFSQADPGAIEEGIGRLGRFFAPYLAAQAADRAGQGNGWTAAGGEAAATRALPPAPARRPPSPKRASRGRRSG